MVKGRRITKKELKEPDEFITVTERAVHFVGDHGRKIIMGEMQTAHELANT